MSAEAGEGGLPYEPEPYHGYRSWSIRSNPSRLGSPWVVLSEREIADWRRAHPEATCSDTTARCLTWLTQEFGGRYETCPRCGRDIRACVCRYDP